MVVNRPVYRANRTSVGSSYEEVAKNGNSEIHFNDPKDKVRMEEMRWDEADNNDSWLRLYAVGVLRSFSNSVTVVKGLRSSKIHVSSFYLGDKNILWVFRSITERDNFIRNKWLWEEQFSSVGVWSKSMTPQSRLSWAEFRGIPLHCWCEEFFKRLGWAVGEPLLVDEETLKRKKLDYGKILVLIPYGQSCPDGIKVISGSSSFSVAVWENPVPVNSEWISKWQGVGEDASFPANDSLYDTQLTMAAVGIMF
ncbi:hypothetical protein Q3G72_024490 [Acer saccharum]|nr:hypothetical protein Q3G72_024490 [Acer saccharum]